MVNRNKEAALRIRNKWNVITSWLQDYLPVKYETLNSPASMLELSSYTDLLGEELPVEFVELYSMNNGEANYGSGTFFGSSFMPLTKIIEQTKLYQSQVKPIDRFIVDEEKSDQIIHQILQFHFEKMSGYNWYKMEFDYSLDSSGGPYIYATENTSPRDREVWRMEWEDRKIVIDLVRQLHTLEKEHYNWDQLDVTLLKNGKCEIERKDFFDEMSFSSKPENAIKKVYTNPKWIPLFSDFGGNYIGIDLDPDLNGVKGQIIIWGPDEDFDRIVVAPSLEGLLDLCIAEIVSGEVVNSIVAEEGAVFYGLRKESHLHDDLRATLKNKNSL